LSQVLVRPKRRTETVSLRIASSLRASLEDEAKKAGVNFNALITQILTRYVTTGRHLGKLKLVPVSKDALREVFQRMSKEAVEDAARTLGKNSAREHILFLFRQATLATVIRFLDFWGGHFEAWDHHYDGRRHLFTMHHDVNLNYSIFVKEYVLSILETVAPRPAEFDISPNSVSFSFEG